MNASAFDPGVRFSTFDAIILVVGSAATFGFAWVDFWIGISIAFVVLHFFLFCNILRMSRPLELLWAGAFSTLAVLATAGVMTWPLAFAVSLMTTVILSIVEMRRPSYHGVAWKNVNPELPAWWQAQTRSRRSPDATQGDDVLIVPVPSLVATLLNRERAKGSPLTRDEVISIRDACPCIAMTPEQAKSIEQRRGYPDIDPEWAWEHWQEARLMFDDLREMPS